jgi:PAS domain S-box-containing protein
LTPENEQTTEESIAQMSGMLKTLPIWFYLKDVQGRYIEVNECYAQAFDRRPEELIGLTDYELYPGDEADAKRATHERVVRTGEPMASGEERRSVGGQTRTISTWKFPIKGDGGTVVAVVGLGLDATESDRAKEELSRQEQRFRFVAEYAADIIWTMDLAYRITYISPSTERFRGFTVDEVIGIPPEKSLTPESRTRFKAVADAAVAEVREGGGHTPSARTIDLELYHKDGHTVWGEAVFSVMRGDDGQPVGLFGIVRDITARVKGEAALRQSEQRYRLLAENIADVIWTVGTDLRIDYISPSVASFSGFEQDEVMALGLEEIFTEESLEVVLGAIEQELVTEREGHEDPDRTRTLELEHRCKDGTTKWAESTISFLRDDQGRLTGFLGVTRDMTERRRAREELASSERRYRMLAENTDDIIWVMDGRWRMTYVSPSARRVLGYTLDELRSVGLHRLMPSTAQATVLDIRARLNAGNGSVPRPERSRTVELQMITKAGKTIWTETTLNFLRNASGELESILGVTRDITARKLAEDALRSSERQLRLRNRVSEVLLTSPDESVLVDAIRIVLDELGCRYGLLGAVDAQGAWTIAALEKKGRGEVDENLLMMQSPLVGPQAGPWGDAIRDSTPRWTVGPLVPPTGGERVRGALVVPLHHHLQLIGALMVGDRERAFDTEETVLLEAVAAKLSAFMRERIERLHHEAQRLEVEQSLRQSEERYRDLFEGALDLIVIAHPDGRLAYVNRAWREVMGHDEGEIGGVNLSDLVHPEDVPRLEDALARVRDGAGIQNLELTFKDREGNGVLVEGTLTGQKHGGSVISIRCIFRDITWRKRAESESEEARRLAELYIDVLCHDINNMNQAIGMVTELAMTRANGSKAITGSLEQTLDQSRAISALITKVRGLTSLTKGELDEVQLDLHSVISDAARRAIDTHPDRVVRVVNPPPSFGVSVRGTELLKDVFFNLIDNAIKYDDHVECVVDVSYTASPDKGYVIVEIADNGPGVPDALKDKIFDRLERGIHLNIRGTGLGLTIASEVVRRSGGAIWVEDRVTGDRGKGARFGVLLPRERPEDGMCVLPTVARGRGKGG